MFILIFCRLATNFTKLKNRKIKMIIMLIEQCFGEDSKELVFLQKLFRIVNHPSVL